MARHVVPGIPKIFCLLLVLLGVQAAALRVAVLQNKGGGHGELGYALGRAAPAGAELVIFQDSAYKAKQAPFSSYGELKAVKVQEIKLSDTSAVVAELSAGKFDVIIDNNSKDPAAVSSFCDVASSTGARKFVYVSSGGMYTGDAPADGSGYAEACCKVKEDNECRTVEVALFNGKMKDKAVSFRPQYIYGDKTNKRGNIDFFVDRIARGVPVPMPGDGSQLVALTHAEDVARLLWAGAQGSAPEQSGIFNAGTDKFVSYAGLCDLIGKKLGKPVTYFKYNPKELSKDLPKPGFPYRPSTFVLNPAKAKAAFGWSVAHDISSDVSGWVDQYLALGLDAKEFAEDAAIAALQTK